MMPLGMAAIDGDFYTYRARLVRVVDADTVDLNIDHGCGITSVQRIRLADLEAPSAATEAGRAATEFTQGWISAVMGSSGFLYLRTFKDRREKWQRYLGVLIDPTKPHRAEWLNNELIDAGHAVRIGTKYTTWGTGPLG